MYVPDELLEYHDSHDLHQNHLPSRPVSNNYERAILLSLTSHKELEVQGRGLTIIGTNIDRHSQMQWAF